MDAKALADWTAFAENGGIGRAVSVKDHFAAQDGQLMFLTGEPIVVLSKLDDHADGAEGKTRTRQEGDRYLGYCEGVVGLFHSNDVRFITPILSFNNDPPPTSSPLLFGSQHAESSSLTHSRIHETSTYPSSPPSLKTIPSQIPSHPNSSSSSSPSTRNPPSRTAIPLYHTHTIISMRGEGGMTTPSPVELTFSKEQDILEGEEEGGQMGMDGGTEPRGENDIGKGGGRMGNGNGHNKDQDEKGSPPVIPISSPALYIANPDSPTSSPTSKSGSSSYLPPPDSSIRLSSEQMEFTQQTPVDSKMTTQLQSHRPYSLSFAARASQRASNPFDLDTPKSGDVDGFNTPSEVGTAASEAINHFDQEMEMAMESKMRVRVEDTTNGEISIPMSERDGLTIPTIGSAGLGFGIGLGALRTDSPSPSSVMYGYYGTDGSVFEGEEGGGDSMDERDGLGQTLLVGERDDARPDSSVIPMEMMGEKQKSGVGKRDHENGNDEGLVKSGSRNEESRSSIVSAGSSSRGGEWSGLGWMMGGKARVSQNEKERQITASGSEGSSTMERKEMVVSGSGGSSDLGMKVSESTRLDEQESNVEEVRSAGEEREEGVDGEDDDDEGDFEMIGMEAYPSPQMGSLDGVVPFATAAIEPTSPKDLTESPAHSPTVGSASSPEPRWLGLGIRDHVHALNNAGSQRFASGERRSPMADQWTSRNVSAPPERTTARQFSSSKVERPSAVVNTWTARNDSISYLASDLRKNVEKNEHRTELLDPEKLLTSGAALKETPSTEYAAGVFGSMPPQTYVPRRTPSRSASQSDRTAVGSAPSSSGHGETSTDTDHTIYTPPSLSPDKFQRGLHYPSPSQLSAASPISSSPGSLTPPQKGVFAYGPLARASASPPMLQSPWSKSATSSPGGTSVSASALARGQSGSTLVAATAVDLTSAKNPVPITFILGGQGSPRDRPSQPSSPKGVFPGAQGLLGSPITPAPTPAVAPPRPNLAPRPLGSQQRRRSRSFSGFDIAQTNFSKTPPPVPNDTHPKTEKAKTTKMERPSTALEARYKGFMSKSGRENATSSPAPTTLQTGRARSKSLVRQPSPTSDSDLRKKPSLPQLRIDTAKIPALPPVPTISPFMPNHLVTGPGLAGRSPTSFPSSPSSSSTMSSSRPKLTNKKSASPSELPSASGLSNRDYSHTVSLEGANFSLTVDGPDAEDAKGHDLASGIPDEWGFIGVSPVPGIFALSAKSGKETSKIEQSLLALIGKPYTPAAAKKVTKQIVEKHLPPSLRTKCYAWLQSSRVPQAPLRLEFASVAKQFKLLRNFSADQPVLCSKFASHRAFSRGFSNVEDMLAVYGYRHPKQARDADLSWIAALVLMQSFDVDEAYGLFEGFVEEHYVAMTSMSTSIDSAVLEEILRSSEPQLAKHLASVGIHTTTFIRPWFTSLFARSLPYPTSIRIMDLVISTGTNFLLRVALGVLSLLSKRLMTFPNGKEMVGYLLDLPADAILSPESVVKAAMKVTVTDEQLKKSRARILSSRRS